MTRDAPTPGQENDAGGEGEGGKGGKVARRRARKEKKKQTKRVESSEDDVGECSSEDGGGEPIGYPFLRSTD